MICPIDTALIQLLMSIEIYKSINMTPPVQEIIIDLAREHRVNSLDLKWSYHDYKAMGGNYRSQTTSTHVGIAMGVADLVRNTTVDDESAPIEIPVSVYNPKTFTKE